MIHLNNRIMTELKRIEIIIDEKNNRFKILNHDNLIYSDVTRYLADSMVHIINDNYIGNKVEFLENLLEPMKQDLINLNKEK